MPRGIHVGLSLMPAEDFRLASLPLFEAGIVDALEWNVDTGWGPHGIPAWASRRLDEYAGAGRLYGHGVEFSLLSAELSPRQQWWLEQLAGERRARRLVHLSEHFGFMTAGDFVGGTPLPQPRTEAGVRVGRDRLARIADAIGAPVGVENLALAFGAEDVAAQPVFVEELLAPLDGFLLLDLHNIHCQSVNFGVAAETLMRTYPLQRVREIHVAGGSWARPASDPAARPFRRDSHDDAVPVDLFPLLARAIELCPRLEVVILERSDHTLFGVEEIERFRDDFRRLRSVVEQAS